MLVPPKRMLLSVHTLMVAPLSLSRRSGHAYFRVNDAGRPDLYLSIVAGQGLGMRLSVYTMLVALLSLSLSLSVVAG
jgi:hypothetical protein